MTHILAVAHDAGAGRFVHAAVSALRDAGHCATVVSGTPALRFLKATDIVPQWTTEQTERVLGTGAFQAVLAGLSSSRKEQLWLDAAVKIGIPTIIFPDTWGAEKRWNGIASAALAFDEVEGRLLMKHGASERCIAHVGDPLHAEISLIPEEVRAAVDAIRPIDQPVILIAGQGCGGSLEHVTFVRVMVGHARTPCTVIVKPHPKFLSDMPHGARRWDAAVAELATLSTVVDLPFTADHLASCADITVTTFGTALRVSAIFARTPVSVVTPGMKAEMLKQTGMPSHPLVQAGAALEYESVPNVIDLMRARNGLARYSPAPFHPRGVIAALEAVLS